MTSFATRIARKTSQRFYGKLALIGFSLFSVFLWITMGLLGATFDQSVAFLPTIVVQVLLLVFQMIGLMIANFALFFGPFLLYAMMGMQTNEPGDASWSVKVSDVRGQAHAVDEMAKILRLIEEGKRYVLKGGVREKGVLMAGPPGTGKTMLAKAIATELNMPMIATSGASFAGMFMGMDVLKVIIMSRRAKKLAKKWGGCIVFIDEFDAIGQRRGGGQGMMGGMMGMSMGQMGLNMLLVVMDGLDEAPFMRKFLRKRFNNLMAATYMPLHIGPLAPAKYNIFFIAATNRPEVLDEAITRPGRFGRRISFKNPDRGERRDILDLYFDKVAHESEFDTEEKRDEVAAITEGYSPAKLQQIMNMALMYAFEDGRQAFGWVDLREAMVNVEVGVKESIIYHEDDALTVARHEMSHALAGRIFEGGKMSIRLSIVKRGDTAGHFSSADIREYVVRFRSQFEARIKVCLASVAGERMFYGENTGGVSGDLEQATSMALYMAAKYGMGQVVGPRDKPDSLGLTLISQPDPTSPAAGLLKDPATVITVSRILASAYHDVESMLMSNRDAIDRLAHHLVVERELVGHEVDDFFAREQWNVPGHPVTQEQKT